MYFRKHLNTWKEAADLCKIFGGFLPWFDSRDSLHALLSLFRLSADFPVVEGIYIGLRFNTSEVSEI